MPAGKYTFTVEQGTTHTFTVVKKDSANQPVDLTGYSGKMQIRSDYADNSSTIYATISSSISNDGTGLYFTPESGSIQVIMSPTVTEGFTFSSGYYDLELYSGSYVERLIEGRVKISKEVTR